MNKTAVIRRDYLHYVKKYNRFEKRHKNVSVHLSPCFRDVSVGDVATVGECRPLSKTVKFNTLKVTRGAGTKKSFKKFWSVKKKSFEHEIKDMLDWKLNFLSLKNIYYNLKLFRMYQWKNHSVDNRNLVLFKMVRQLEERFQTFVLRFPNLAVLLHWIRCCLNFDAFSVVDLFHFGALVTPRFCIDANLVRWLMVALELALLRCSHTSIWTIFRKWLPLCKI